VDDGERTADGFPAQVMTAAEERGPAVAVPDQVDVWIGLNVGKQEHFADVLDDASERLFSRSVAYDQAAIEAVLDRAAGHGIPGLVTGQPGSIAQLALAVAGRRGVPVASVPGLVMRRAADLYPGEAKTDCASPT
jgi:Transposase